MPFAGRGQGQGQKRANVLLGIPGLGIKSSQVPTVSSIAPGSSKDGKDSSDPGKGMGHFPDRSDSNDDTYVDKIACDPCLVFGVVSPTYNTPKPRRPCVAWWALVVALCVPGTPRWCCMKARTHRRACDATCDATRTPAFSSFSLTCDDTCASVGLPLPASATVRLYVTRVLPVNSQHLCWARYCE